LRGKKYLLEFRSRTIVKGSREQREKRGTRKRGGSSIMETNERIDSLGFALETEELKQ